MQACVIHVHLLRESYFLQKNLIFLRDHYFLCKNLIFLYENLTCARILFFKENRSFVWESYFCTRIVFFEWNVRAQNRFCLTKCARSSLLVVCCCCCLREKTKTRSAGKHYSYGSLSGELSSEAFNFVFCLSAPQKLYEKTMIGGSSGSEVIFRPPAPPITRQLYENRTTVDESNQRGLDCNALQWHKIEAHRSHHSHFRSLPASKTITNPKETTWNVPRERQGPIATALGCQWAVARFRLDFWRMCRRW